MGEVVGLFPGHSQNDTSFSHLKKDPRKGGAVTSLVFVLSPEFEPITQALYERGYASVSMRVGRELRLAFYVFGVEECVTFSKDVDEIVTILDGSKQ